MDNRAEIREFLTTRRAKIAPETAGFGAGGNRRVAGLRREEVAVLAGMSVDYYTRIERGGLDGASDVVLAAIAGALRLDDAETTHLFDLARSAQPSRTIRHRTIAEQVRPGVQLILDAMVGIPARVRNERMDLLGANSLGYALYSDMFTSAARPVNNARFVFLDPRARTFYPEWEKGADDIVATLRGYAGRNPHDKALSNLIGELATQSTEFSSRWAAHNVRHHQTGVKRIHHSVVGELELRYEGMELAADTGLTLYAYYAEPMSDTAERLGLLASWAATTAAEARSNRSATTP